MKDSHLAWLSDDYLICRLLEIPYPHFPSLDLYDFFLLIVLSFQTPLGKLTKIQEVVHVVFQRGVAEEQGTSCGPRWSSCS